MKMPSEQTMRRAITHRDPAYDGRFFYAVITTGVFCRPSCAARPARPENLRFFPTAQAASDEGFRACKRCHPTDSVPRSSNVIEIARYIEAHSEERLTLAALAALAGLSPSRLQRVFKQAFGVSPKAYQDAVRLRRFKELLRDGDGVTGAIYSAGFGSVSRVYGEQLRAIGMTPKVYRAGGAGENIVYACRDTSLGPMMMAATERGVCFVQFGDDTKTLLARLLTEYPQARLIASPESHAPELDTWIELLNTYLAGAAPQPDLPLDLRGTAFQVQVWRFLLSVREGEVLSYSEVATRIGRPKAVRAVASACAANRIGVLVPCHRVLRGDGGLGGYRWGLARKRALLDAERTRKEV